MQHDTSKLALPRILHSVVCCVWRAARGLLEPEALRASTASRRRASSCASQRVHSVFTVRSQRVHSVFTACSSATDTAAGPSKAGLVHGQRQAQSGLAVCRVAWHIAPSAGPISYSRRARQERRKRISRLRASRSARADCVLLLPRWRKVAQAPVTGAKPTLRQRALQDSQASPAPARPATSSSTVLSHGDDMPSRVL